MLRVPNGKIRERLNRRLELDREKPALQRQGYTETPESGLQVRRYLRLSNGAFFIWVELRYSSRNLLTPNGHWRIPSFKSPAFLFSRLLSGKRGAF